MASAPSFPVTRADALARLAQFVPQAGAAYAKGRNFDHGPGQHRAVSRLSAALRRRTISEAEVVRAVLAAHGPEAAASFISEVFWRTYWKGWLEQRPAIWTRYLAGRDAATARLARDPDLAARHRDALTGRTGIDAFDHWIGELAETGYLHNWARMQVASIWIFTLGLPWQLGAAHFLDQLRDGDPASNTLSWRWVAGLHTAGKAYLADAARITAMTDGRFHPRGLATQAIIPGDAPAPLAAPWRTTPAVDPGRPALLWITPEDAGLEQEAALARLPVRAVVACRSDAGTAADAAALDDALARAAAHWNAPVQWINSPAELAAAAQGAGTTQIVTGFVPVGLRADALPAIRAALSAQGCVLAEHLRAWDKAVWPHCRRGFFALKQEIPALLKDLA
ncbi:FAD-binding domain-containing protein [Novosphingobium pokkalii]|uniref:FAD-binding domain-containing protein n=1 Tax=Novosphingobium pokkalii TaxID=1770194 RepID=A0ABV7UYS2_9SPHN|nr:FAD-binding domain-containing protein [Novosphingobium pokkalii]GHC99223.1 hypothetical protein GCM10019060_31670 [Novosphingobium pokkalii]